MNNELVNKIRKVFPKGSEVIRFLIIGGIATIIDMLVMAFVIFISCKQHYASFLEVFTNSSTAPGYIVAIGSLIGFIVGLVFNYIFSIHYVYLGDNKYAKNKKSFLIFALLSLIGLVIQTLGVYVGYEVFKVNEWIVKIIFVIIVLIFNYLTRKRFVFNKTNSEQIVNNESFKEKIKIFNSKDRKYLIFFAFLFLFFIYLVVSIVSNYYLNAGRMNTLFGNDSRRVISDWSVFWANHYRTKVHPLYVILVFPIISISNVLGLDPTLAIIFFICFIATINAYLFYKILAKISDKKLGWLLIIFVLFYAFAFSQIEHILIIESFILGSFSLLVFWTYFVYNFRKEKKWYNLLWQLTIIGTLVFGFVSTNIFHFFLGTAILLIFNKKKTFKQFLKDCGLFLLIMTTTFALSYILILVQKIIFPSSVNAVEYIFTMLGDVINGTRNGEEMEYVNKDINFEKFITVLLNYLGVSLGGGETSSNNCVWVSPNFISKIILLVVSVLTIYSFIVTIKHRKNVHLVIGLMGCLLFEFGLHYFYGYGELMLYAVNFSFIPYILIANGLSYHKNRFKKYVELTFVGLFIICLISSSITTVLVLKEFYKLFGSAHPSILKTNYRFIILLLIMFMSVCLFVTIRQCLKYREKK